MIIDKFIVHMLDINLDKPMLADFKGKDYSDVDKFLKKLITKCQKHDETMRAKWKYAEEFIQDCCKNIFEDENNFTNASKQIAAHYYDLMKNNNILEPVTLVICQYTVNATQNIAIMRLENKKTYNFERMQKREPRSKNEIGFSSIRGGNIVGEHSVKFFGENETLELKHTAYSRQVFAEGALKAAKFLVNQKPGLYDMKNLV